MLGFGFIADANARFEQNRNLLNRIKPFQKIESNSFTKKLKKKFKAPTLQNYLKFRDEIEEKRKREKLFQRLVVYSIGILMMIGFILFNQ